MKISSKYESHNTWDATAESLIAILSWRLGYIRQQDPLRICKKLNFEYLRKRRSVKKDTNYGPTPLQRSIIDETGY